MSSHPSEKAIRLHFNTSGLSVSIKLEGAVLDEVISFAQLSIRNYQPWILECFELMTDRGYECKACNKLIICKENSGDNIVELARNHIVQVHQVHVDEKNG